MFSRQKIQFEAPDGIQEVVAASHRLVLRLANKTLMRIPLKDPSKQNMVDLNTEAKKIFMDYSGHHVIITFTNGEIGYLHSIMSSPKLQSKLKGYIVTSVGFNPQGNEQRTGFILLGTSKGQLLEVEFAYDEKTNTGALVYVKQIYCLPEPEPISSINVSFMSGAYLITFTAKDSLYPFLVSGIPDVAETTGPALASFFSQQNSENIRFHNLPGAGNHSAVCVHGQDPPTNYAWLVAHGVKYGTINCNDPDLDAYKMTSQSQFLKLGDAQAMNLLEHHVLILRPNRFTAFCTLNQEVVYDDNVATRFGKTIGLAKDEVSGVFWLYTKSAIIKYRVVDEHSHVWRLFLDQKKFVEARKVSRTQAELQLVLQTEAEALFEENKFTASAELFAASGAGLEEVALKFMEIDGEEARQALKKFLLKRLDATDLNDRTQITLMVLWLTEIFLTELSQARTSGLGHVTSDLPSPPKAFDPEVYRSLRDAFRTFLRRPAVIATIQNNLTAVRNLMATHGEMDSMQFLSELLKDQNNVISLHIQQEHWDEALKTLQTCGDYNLWYRHAPQLFAAVPEKAVNAWIQKGGGLRPMRLLPALFRAKEDTKQTAAAVKYLEYCVETLCNRDKAIHNALLALYSKLNREKLLEYLIEQGLDSTLVCYDLKFALRTCLSSDLSMACVHIYSAMGLFEEAVTLALKIEDLTLAKSCADACDSDEDLKRKLWLRIAEYVVGKKGDLQKCTDLLQESNNLLKIQDLLPFFPEFAKIEPFKEPLCQCLAEHSNRIAALQDDMSEATMAAKKIKEQISISRQRYTVVRLGERCTRCSHPLMIRDFCVFPCRHHFHGDCLESEVMELRGAEVSLLADAAEECPLCGDAMIHLVNKPFHTPAEYLAELKTWD